MTFPPSRQVRAAPAFVPTLTDVVQPSAQVPAAAAPSEAGATAEYAPARWTEEALVEQVVQRVEAMLEQRLREAIAAQVVALSQPVLEELKAELPERVRGILRELWVEQNSRSGRPPSAN